MNTTNQTLNDTNGALNDTNHALPNSNQPKQIASRSPLQDAFRRFRKNKAAMFSCSILFLIVLFVIFAPILSSYNYSDADWSNMGAKPSFANKHFFGTDSLGRDLFVRTAMGGRISLIVGVVGAGVAIFIGTIYGAISGYIGGKVDMVMMRFIEVLNSFPIMFLLIILVTMFGRSISLIFIAIGMVSWTGIARLVRGQTLSLRRREFIEAAHVIGVSDWNIVMRHITPNVIGVVVVYGSLLIPGMIMFESFLSFLGIGVQEPMTSWGALIEVGTKTMEIAPWQLLIPAAFLVVTLFCFSYIGDGLRDAFDPKDR
ncbi:MULTISPECIES: oligopeptide ABC transporter permease OppC [unclassified Acinetobacter]|uniref:oligopeptide ABC transporter permease OppC n=1 Tax=unclassified Acinetobacter TaxID=196816 RepID=UPI0035B79DE6